MPLFMDIHTVDSDSFSVEEVVKAHMEDLAIQDKFKVRQLKYWVNVEAKTLFCLMEGPNREACNAVHLESHGNTACNIIEVSDDEFHLFLGIGKDLNDLAQTTSGDIDTGYRSILLARLADITGKHKNVIEEVKGIIHRYKGVLILRPGNDVIASFIFAEKAMNCAIAIKKLIQSNQDKFEYNLAIASGRPVDEIGQKLFEETKAKVQCLCAIGSINTFYVDSDTVALSANDIEASEMPITDFTIVRNSDFIFLNRLFKTLNTSINRLEFKSKYLHTLLGLSKSQTYRKILSRTGMAPNQLIQEFRLQQSLYKIMQQGQTISEIAYDCGFNSPSYYTKLFRKRFGLTPTSFAKQQFNKE